MPNASQESNPWPQEITSPGARLTTVLQPLPRVNENFNLSFRPIEQIET